MALGFANHPICLHYGCGWHRFDSSTTGPANTTPILAKLDAAYQGMDIGISSASIADQTGVSNLCTILGTTPR
nr:hypothetical; ORF3 [Lymphoproliferative disease virus]